MQTAGSIRKEEEAEAGNVGGAMEKLKLDDAPSPPPASGPSTSTDSAGSSRASQTVSVSKPTGACLRARCGSGFWVRAGVGVGMGLHLHLQLRRMAHPGTHASSSVSIHPLTYLHTDPFLPRPSQ